MILPATQPPRTEQRKSMLREDDAIPTFFRCDCETCLTPLHIRVEHLGQPLRCPRCGHGFTAEDVTVDAFGHKVSGSGELQRRVMRFLRDRGISGLQHVKVELQGQSVVLRGRVPSPRDRWLCVNCCARVAGVQRVIDKLEAEAIGAEIHSTTPRWTDD